MLARIEKLAWIVAAASVIALGLMITTNIFTRSVFRVGIPDSVIMVRELMVAAIVLPLGAATYARSHVTVDFVTNRMSPRARTYMIIFGSIVGLFALSMLMYAGWREFTGAWSKGSYYFGDLGLAKWPARFIFVAGIAIGWLRLWEMIFRDIRTLRSGGHVVDDGEGTGH